MWGRHRTDYMLDTNTFDYIYDNGLTNKVQNTVDSGKLLLFATDVQKQEIEKIQNSTRKQAIRQVVAAIQVRFIRFIDTSAAVVALGQQQKRGFIGSRVGSARVIDAQDIPLLEILERVNMKYPLKNKADLLIFYTALKENMDYLITGNTDDFKKSLELFKNEK